MSRPAIVKTALLLPNRTGDMMSADVRHAKGNIRSPLLVICHSFMAFKDWGFFPYCAERFAESGFVTVSFNFSHNGVIGDGNRITDFARFERNTFTREIDDLGALVEGLMASGAVSDVGDVNRIGVLGHSRGGGIALVHAAADSRIRAVATWSGIATFNRWTDHQKTAWRNSGHLPLAKNSTISPLRFGLEILRDVEENGDRLDILAAAARLARPWLILHGREDVTVPVREAEAMFAASDKSLTELRILEHVGHLYHAATRAEDNYRTLDGIIGTSAQWLHRTLS